MSFNIYNILIIVGVIQGFIFTGIVFFNKKYHAKSTFYLITLIFVYSINNLMYIIPDIGVMSLYKMYNVLFLPFGPIIPVLIYFYVVYFLNPLKKLNWKDKLLFFPFCLFSILVIYFRIKYFLGSQEDVVDAMYIKVILTNEMFSVLFSIVLLIISIKKIVIVQKQQKIFNPKIVQTDLKWLLITMSVILFFTFYWAYLTYLNIFTSQSNQVSFYWLWIVVACLIYWFGHIGIYQYGIVSERKKIRQFIKDHSDFINNNSNLSSLSKHSSEHITALNNFLIQEKAYLNSGLSLDNVAEKLQLSSSYLSRIVNSELNTSFPDYLNSLRVNEAKLYLQNPEFSNYTITAIGLEAGFNSKSAFYEVFKKSTGKTPLAFKKEIQDL